MNSRCLRRFFAFGLIAWLALAGSLGAQNAEPRFGMVGLDYGSFLRMSFFNAAEINPRYPPNPCTARVEFFDEHGVSLSEPAELEIPAGQARHVDFSNESFFDSPRLETRPVVSFVDRPASSCASLVASAQLINSLSQATRIHIRPETNAGPQSFFDMLGVNPGSTLRVTLLNAAQSRLWLPSSPCLARVSFFLADGSPASESVALTIPPGEARHAEFVMGLWDWLRLEVRPQVSVSERQRHACSELIATAQLVQMETLATTLHVAAAPLGAGLPNPGPIGER